METLNKIYDDKFYRDQLYEGLYWEHRKLGGIIGWMFGPITNSFLDVGCGFGGVTHELSQHYKKKLCIDGSLTVVKFMLPEVMEHFKCLNIIAPDFEIGAFDLVFSFEVAEHIEPENADTFIKFLTTHCDKYLILTAAPPGQNGTHHVNMQPKAYWVKKLNDNGFELDNLKMEKWNKYAKKQLAHRYYHTPIICKPVKTNEKI